MKSFLTTAEANMARAICSKGFIIAVIGSFLAAALGTSGLAFEGADIINLLGLSLNGSSSIILIVCILPVLPFSSSFASEWSERSFRFWVIRVGIRAYSCAKTAACALAGFLATFAGLSLFVLFFSLFYPLFTSVSVSNAYSVFLEKGQPVLYLLLFITHISLSSVIFSILAFFISAYFRNSFTTTAMPVVIYLVALRLFDIISPIKNIPLSVYIEAVYGAGGPLRSFLLKLIITAAITLILGFFAYRQIRKLVQND